MGAVTCPHCNVSVPPQEVADGWCENCGKKLPAFALSAARIVAGVPAAPPEPRPRRDAEEDRTVSGRCDFCSSTRVQNRQLVVSGISWKFFVIPPIVSLFNPRLRQLTNPAYSMPCSSCADCSRRFSRLQWKRVFGLVLSFAVFPIGCLLYLPLGAQRDLNETQRALAIGILIGTFVVFLAMPFLVAFYLNRRLRDVMGVPAFDRMMAALEMRRLGMKHVGLRDDTPAWGKTLRW